MSHARNHNHHQPSRLGLPEHDGGGDAQGVRGSGVDTLKRYIKKVLGALMLLPFLGVMLLIGWVIYMLPWQKHLIILLVTLFAAGIIVISVWLLYKGISWIWG